MNITLTEEMKRAMELINSSNRPIYITGKAGTGKTTLLRYMVENISKKFVVTASTGIAAINAGGVTLHSFMGIPMGIHNPSEKLEGHFSGAKIALVNTIDALIIDEVSMIHPDIIDYIDRKLRRYRKSDKPFGGVQLIMFGDLFQLPPVVPKQEMEAIRFLYPGVYFFYANVFKRCGFDVVELTHIFRQADSNFIGILNNIRTYNLTSENIEDLAEVRDRALSEDFSGSCLHICSLKRDVTKINEELLGEYTHSFQAQIEGDFNPKAAPCDIVLKLREGARVMMLVNDKKQGFSNGSLGTVSCITDISVEVELDHGGTATVEKHKWHSYKYTVDKGKVTKKETGSCLQFPVTLAWAITIHKSQGLTFDNIVIHAKSIFSPGQIYVALSRCKTLEGIATDTFITNRHILPDTEILAFEESYRNAGFFFNPENIKQAER